jgi:hypothetical protein
MRYADMVELARGKRLIGKGAKLAHAEGV